MIDELSQAARPTLRHRRYSRTAQHNDSSRGSGRHANSQNANHAVRANGVKSLSVLYGKFGLATMIIGAVAVPLTMTKSLSGS